MIGIKQTFLYTGATQTFKVPNIVSSVFIQAWGAAGGSGLIGTGGPGGYSQGTLAVSPADNLGVIVGQGGISYLVNQATAILPTFGGGGAGGNSTEIYKGSSAGGRSAILSTSNTEIMTAGGGGGSASSYFAGGTTIGGGGGGTSGTAAVHGVLCYTVAAGKGGTQTAGGAGGLGWTIPNNGIAGAAFTGGTGGLGSNGGASAGAAGGGGGGYFGGGGGAGQFQAGGTCPITPTQQDASGGGGSGFISPVLLSALTIGTFVSTTNPNSSRPPLTTDQNYISGIGAAVGSTIGGNGLVVFTYSIPTLRKSVDKANAGIGETLNYTLVLDNISGVTINNIVFVDTIPNGTTFVPNSLTVNNSQVSGSPAPPGVNLGNISTVITIIYSVLVTTIPSPNPILNVGSIAGTNLDPTISNTISTKVNYVNMPSSKIVNKAYANIGDILTYTIPVRNLGNTTAQTLVLIDTIPNGTSYIAGSLSQDGVTVSGVNGLISATLPLNLPVNKITTITFKVQINTIPCPNPIPNSALVTSSFITDSTTTPNRTGSSSTNTNIVFTVLNTASLSGSVKYTDKSYANCGDVITYTIVAPNSGTTIAQNVIFKDTIPNGTVLVPTSVYINGVQQLGVNPSSGVTIPNIDPGSTATLTFSVQVQC